MTRTLIDSLDSLGGGRLTVVGDVMLDRYISGDVDRTSPEAPVPVLSVTETNVYPGGAAGVAFAAANLGCDVSLYGVVGDDADGTTLTSICADSGIQVEGLIVDPTRCTTRKDRFIGRSGRRHGQQLMRVDQECIEDIPTDLQEQLLRLLENAISNCQLLVLSDYAKGTLSPSLCAELRRLTAERRILMLVDPGKGRDFSNYRGVSVLKPNRLEAEAASGCQIDSISDAVSVATWIRKTHQIESVVITLDKDGCVSVGDGWWQHIPTRAQEVYDITGAGDLFIAGLAAAMSNDLPFKSGLEVANLAASLSVQHRGTAFISTPTLRAHALRSHASSVARHSAVLTANELEAAIENHRRQGETIVLTNGCFDLLHVGHVSYLQEASGLGDVLVVGVNADQTVRRLKGADRPVVPEQDRASLVAALKCVDYVVIFNEPTPHRLIKLIRPDTLVKGGTYTPAEVVGGELVDSYGGRVCVTGMIPDVSTTRVIDRICGDRDGAMATDNH